MNSWRFSYFLGVEVSLDGLNLLQGGVNAVVFKVNVGGAVF